jgi:hypothetical protein
MPRKQYHVYVAHNVDDWFIQGDLYKSCWTIRGAQQVKERVNRKWKG